MASKTGSKFVTKCVEAPEKTSQLDQLKQWTVIVEDTGDLEKIRAHKPQDATTNPTLVYQASQMPQYQHLVHEAVEYGDSKGQTKEERVSLAMDYLYCLFGREISKVIPGYVSTEVDARLSFDTGASIRKAKTLLAVYDEMGVPRDRILIKLASTWEMFQACHQLEKEGIKTNMTLLFSMTQAKMAAQMGATLISPFVGRILDWYKKSTGKEYYPANDLEDPEDPGVLSVRAIHAYYKCHGIKTIIMGASFRNVQQIRFLAGCDRLTISPKFIDELAGSTEPLRRQLDLPDSRTACAPPSQQMDEKTFRWLMNEDAMASDKLAEGIRGFAADIVKLEDDLGHRMAIDGPGWIMHDV